MQIFQRKPEINFKLRFLIDSNNGEETPVRLATGRMGEVYKECGVETNSLKSFSDRVQEELTVFFTKVSIISILDKHTRCAANPDNKNEFVIQNLKLFLLQKI